MTMFYSSCCSITNFTYNKRHTQHLNNMSIANSIARYDFTSLYTKIMHTNLITNIEWYIDLAFKGTTNAFLFIQKVQRGWEMSYLGQ